MNGKIILNLAVSLDGYIADDTGGYDWITGDGNDELNTNEPFSFEKFLEGIDVVVMGGECYRQGMGDSYTGKKLYVATGMQQPQGDNPQFIDGDIVSIIQQEKASGKNIFLFGGGITIDPFIKADAIDEYIVGIIPTILGGGRKLFLKNNPTIPLRLTGYSAEGGIVILTYSKR